MKLSTIVSTVLALGATQAVASDNTTSTLTTTITRTLVRVDAVTPTSTPVASSSTPLIHTSTPVASSTLVPSNSASATGSATTPTGEPVHTGAAAGFERNMPVALAGGAFALVLGAL